LLTATFTPSLHSAVSPTSRRIFLYWLLLLVPTLVVGAGAIHLLRREQARLNERGAYADEARRAAIAARARLIVENVELLVGDVESGLLDTLAAEPAGELDAFLEQWEESNPLVRTAFRATDSGRILRPVAGAGSEEAQGFVRRFLRLYGMRPPWSEAPGANADAPEKREQEKTLDEAAARKDVAANVAQVQSARRDVQELFKNQGLYAPAGAAPAAPAAAASADLADATPDRTAMTRSRVAEADRTRQDVQPPGAAAATSPAVRAERVTPAPSYTKPRLSRPESKTMQVAQGQGYRAKEAAPDRRGWLPAALDGRLHLFGWVQPGGVGDVRGVEVELAALISRLGGALPAEPGSGEGFALRDDQGRVLHQAGAVPRTGEPLVRVPFAAALLPGWDVVAFLAAGPASSGNGAAFFWLSVMLVGIFVAAILAGGSLLLWQARRSEEEAAQKTSFVANVSHEFKTPLTTIRLYSELLEQGRVRDQTQGGQYLRTIGRETERLARLVNNALDFSRLEQGRKRYACEPIDLTTELGRLLDTHAPRVAEAGLVLKRELPATSVVATADRDALEQIVLNLIDNACKYAADGGEVAVTLAPRTGGGAEVRVSDRGPGVPPDHRERIFEKFHRVDDALTAEKTGAGLGLSIARQLARGLGGELRYEARAGSGAEFVLELP
jgi:signal transduction histidine kinase